MVYKVPLKAGKSRISLCSHSKVKIAHVITQRVLGSVMGDTSPNHNSKS